MAPPPRVVPDTWPRGGWGSPFDLAGTPRFVGRGVVPASALIRELGSTFSLPTPFNDEGVLILCLCLKGLDLFRACCKP